MTDLRRELRPRERRSARVRRIPVDPSANAAQPSVRSTLAVAKELVWFEHSGHNPEHEEALAFDEFMVERVLTRTGGAK